MSERVSVIEGKNPVIVVAPHGAPSDDYNTGVITEKIAIAMRAYAVINWGWERADSVDTAKDQANCNNIHHCHQDVVRDEFLEPISRFRSRIDKKYGSKCYIFYIHGLGTHIHKKAPDLDMVVGYGNGMPPSLTCQTWMKNCFVQKCQENGFVVYEGKAGGEYAGWSRVNLNQLFRKWYIDLRVQSMQLELAYDLRKTVTDCNITAERLALSIDEFIQVSKWDEPLSFFVEEI